MSCSVYCGEGICVTGLHMANVEPAIANVRISEKALSAVDDKSFKSLFNIRPDSRTGLENVPGLFAENRATKSFSLHL